MTFVLKQVNWCVTVSKQQSMAEATPLFEALLIPKEKQQNCMTSLARPYKLVAKTPRQEHSTADSFLAPGKSHNTAVTRYSAAHAASCFSHPPSLKVGDPSRDYKIEKLVHASVQSRWNTLNIIPKLK